MKIKTKTQKRGIPKIRIAVGSITDELRNMEVGEIVQFPVSKYKWPTIRSAACGLLNERLEKGMHWKTRLNSIEKCIDVTRDA